MYRFTASLMTMARALSIVAGATGCVGVATAQQSALPRLDPVGRTMIDRDRGVTLDVRQRIREEFEPIGLRAGTFKVLPSVAIGAGFDTNLFADPNRRQSAALLQAEPALTAISSFSNGEVRLDGSGRWTRFPGHGEANETSYRLAAAGRYTLRHATDLEVGAERQLLVERRDSSGRPDGILAPIRFFQTQAYAHLRYDGGRFRALANVDYTLFDFRSTRALTSSGVVIGEINQDARDQGTLRGSLRGEYTIGNGLSLFVEGIAARIAYRLDESAPGIPNLDGTNLTALAGVALGQGRLIQGSVGVGYVRRSFRAARFQSIGGIAANAQLRYFFTPLVTFSLVASRSVEEAVLQQSTGFVANAVEVRADYEMLRSLILNARVAYRRNDFRDSPRRDTIAEAGAGARYSANRRLSFDVDATYLRRTVKGDPFSPDYNDLRAVVGTRYAF